MTHRLFHDDAYRRECATQVRAVRRAADGRDEVALEATVFYPASGGQPADAGTIAGLPVADVREEGGEIWHALAPDPGAAPLAPGQAVEAVIDWARRFDHMQQHTGQHILSQAFLRAVGAQTVAVHMDRSCTLDLAVAALDAGGAAAAEDLANAVVMENRPVRTTEVDLPEAAAMGLRRPPKQTGRLRVVEVDGFDRSACGGTHVRASGEVGPIAIRGWERYKGGVRVEFVCGSRALRDSRRLRERLRALTARLGAAADDLPAAVERLAERARELERELGVARRALHEHEAAALLARATGPPRVVAAAFADRSIEDLRGLARALTAPADGVAILAAGRHLLVARGAEVSLDAAAVVRDALAAFGGRGGGREVAAEGAAPAAPSAEALVAAAVAVARARLAAPP
ncbi:MAG: alanyl-tRNA editing protein [Armatimonadota bacterium]|nr:alanyl-tRNA editing protein [Armatimonadota bacterium]